MKPYYETELGKLYHGDCLEIMDKFTSGSVSVCITSPPYNLGNNHHTNTHRHTPYNDYSEELKYQTKQTDVINEINRILYWDGWLFYNHKHRIKNGKMISPNEWLTLTSFILKQEIVWHNGSPNMDKCRFFPFTERIYCLAKSEDSKIYNRLNLTDDWHISPVGAGGVHKRQFPVEIPNNLINSVGYIANVLDPYFGAGTVGVACEKNKIGWVGIEIEEKYCEIAANRIEQERKQLKLF